MAIFSRLLTQLPRELVVLVAGLPSVKSRKILRRPIRFIFLAWSSSSSMALIRRYREKFRSSLDDSGFPINWYLELDVTRHDFLGLLRGLLVFKFVVGLL